MLTHTKEVLLQQQLEKIYQIKSDNKEAKEIVKELAKSMLILYEKIREKNQAVDKKRFNFEISMLENRCIMLRGQLASFGIFEKRRRQECTI